MFKLCFSCIDLSDNSVDFLQPNLKTFKLFDSVIINRIDFSYHALSLRCSDETRPNDHYHDQTKSLALLNAIVIVLAALNMNNIRALGNLKCQHSIPSFLPF